MVDMQITLGLDVDIDARMTRQEVEHVVEEPDAGGDRRAAFAVEIDHDLDVGFLVVRFTDAFRIVVLRGAPRLLSGVCPLRQSPRAIALPAAKS
jgi:hypothetical protein